MAIDLRQVGHSGLLLFVLQTKADTLWGLTSR